MEPEVCDSFLLFPLLFFALPRRRQRLPAVGEDGDENGGKLFAGEQLMFLLQFLNRISSFASARLMFFVSGPSGVLGPRVDGPSDVVDAAPSRPIL